MAEIHLAGKLFSAQERPRSEDEEEEDDWLNLGDARFESDIERRYAHSRWAGCGVFCLHFKQSFVASDVLSFELQGCGVLQR